MLRRRRTRPEPVHVRADRIHDRIEVLETQRLELLADEGVPGRKHRLDAVTAAQQDLRTELEELGPAQSSDSVPASGRFSVK